MPTLLTFGDSNTHGTLPIEFEGQRRRLSPNLRWPGRVCTELGPEWTLIEEGLPGRTICRSDHEMGPHMDGRLGLFIALESHGPIDILTIMLGTNDLKAQFDVSVDTISQDIAALLEIALSVEMQERHGGFDILLICPPPVLERGFLADKFAGGAAKSAQLADALRVVAKAHTVEFLNAGDFITSSSIDGIHFDAEMHDRLGQAVATSLRTLINPG